MSKYAVLVIEQIKEALGSAFHYANRQMRQAESDQFERVIQSLRSGQTQLIPTFKISDTQPPYDSGRNVRFDVWGRCWDAKTDTFEWERFPNCYMSPESTSIGAKLQIEGLPNYAQNYRLEYWSPIAVPRELDDKDRFLYSYEGK